MFHFIALISAELNVMYINGTCASAFDYGMDNGSEVPTVLPKAPFILPVRLSKCEFQTIHGL